MHSAARRRRSLARALSRAANAGAAEALSSAISSGGNAAWRIGVTGAPGSGKSSLIAQLARERLEEMPEDDRERLAVLAIDPSSPLSQGALLGDRIRMNAVSDDPRLYFRSLSSRGGRDGLTHNIVDLLGIVDAYGFDEVILETVGVGQAEHAVRTLVDSLVLVLHPESGDSIQAMKAGVMELADVYVVNKADLPGAKRTLAELKATLKLRPPLDPGWSPPVLAVSQEDPPSYAALNAALQAHREHVSKTRNEPDLSKRRRQYHLESLILRRISELQRDDGTADPCDLDTEYRRLVTLLAEDAQKRYGRGTSPVPKM